MKLNLACGNLPEEGWINTDIVGHYKVRVLDMNKYPWRFRDNLFDEIKIINSIHCVKELPKFLDECARVLKPKGKLYIEGEVAMSPEFYNDPYVQTRLGYNSFEIYNPNRSETYKEYSKSLWITKKRRWIFSHNKYLRWLSFIPNMFPKAYARFFYYYFPSNAMKWTLEVVK